VRHGAQLARARARRVQQQADIVVPHRHRRRGGRALDQLLEILAARQLRADADHLAEVRRLRPHRIDHGLVRRIDDRENGARVHHVLLQVVGGGQLADRHRDRAGMDHREDRRGGLERVAHEDEHAFAALELQPAQRARQLADRGGELVERPHPIAFAQRRSRPGTTRQGAVEQPRGEVPDPRHARKL
jgi:hypothetical protein